MGYFSNNKDVDFETLKLNNKYIEVLRKNNIDTNMLLDSIQNKNYKKLEESLRNGNRKNIDIMEPLLYVVKKECGTYEVYKHCDEEFQKNLYLISDILIEEPEVIIGTDSSNDGQFILEAAKVNPKVIKYMSQNLKENTTFITKLCNLENTEIIKYAAKECKMPDTILENTSLAADRLFMMEAIKDNANILEYTPDELKNDYKFIRETSKENYEVVDYVINNVDKFDLDAIRGARDTTKEFTIDDCMKIIDEMSEKSDDKRYQKVKEKVAERGIDDVHTMRWVTAMVAQNDDISPEMLKKVLDYSVLTMSKTQRDLTEDGKEKVTIDNIQEMITPQILNKLKEKSIQQGIKIDSELEQKLEKYTEFYDKYREKIKEEKAKQRIKKDKYNFNYTEKVIKNASLKGIEKETEVIRKELGKELNTKEKELGEK